jgi:hypothetical protein
VPYDLASWNTGVTFRCLPAIERQTDKPSEKRLTRSGESGKVPKSSMTTVDGIAVDGELGDHRN